jgi:hypothetical protein
LSDAFQSAAGEAPSTCAIDSDDICAQTAQLKVDLASYQAKLKENAANNTHRDATRKRKIAELEQADADTTKREAAEAHALLATVQKRVEDLHSNAQL